MKIFDQVEPWPSKVNFIDENNVVLGYDMEGQCCESFGWFITSTIRTKVPKKTPPVPTHLNSWRFDTKFFKQIEIGKWGDETILVFRIIRGKQSKYIHLYNCHNGYYAHGFEFAVGEKKIKEGCI